MAGPAGAPDDALEQALQAQLASRAYLDGWRCRYAPAAGASALPPYTPGGTLAMAHTTAQVKSNGARQEPARAPAGASGATAAAQAARPKPVPPPRSGEQRKAALDAARQRNAELAGLRAGLQSGELTLAELLALAHSGHAAGRMLVRTALMALPGIRTARASQLMTQAGIGDGCRAGALSARQREQLAGAVGTVRL